MKIGYKQVYINIEKTKQTNMKMFKITKEDFWIDKNGKKRNFIKYMKSNNIKNVLLHFGLDNIIKVQEV